MMKYGESGSSDEDRSGSRSDNEREDEEEEEECQILLNRVPKRQRQEEKPTQGGATLIPKWKEYRLPQVRTGLKQSAKRWERCKQSIG
jgi:hypothetical protein